MIRLEDFTDEDCPKLPNRPQTVPTARGRSEPFLKGPIPLAWLAKAASLRKPALAAGLCLWFQRGVSKSSGPVRVGGQVRKKLGLSAAQMLRGLRALETASLIRFEKCGRGRCAVVQIVEAISPPTVPTENTQ